MGEAGIPLITFYKGWITYQQSLVETIAPLSDEQLTLPAAQHHWNIGRLAQHIVGNRAWWFQLWMGEGGPELAPLVQWNDGNPPPITTAAELVAGLESTWQMVQETLSRWTAADLDDLIQLPSALSEEERKFFRPSTRGWIIWHVLEHEIHHGGELSLALGGYGLEGIYGPM